MTTTAPQLPDADRLRWPVVLFDLDGTLCDTVPLIVASYQVAYREVLGVEIDEATIRPWVGKTLPDAFAGQQVPVEEMIAAYRRFNLAHLEELQRDYPGIPELLDSLVDAGAQIGVVTSKSRQTAYRSLVASGLETKISLLACQLETPEHKPHPAPLWHALKQLGRQPSDAVYVGDSTWDLAAARNAGMAGIGVTWGAASRAELEGESPVAVVDTAADLRQLLTTVAP